MQEPIDYQKLDKQAPQGAFSTLDAEILGEEIKKLEPGQYYVEIGVDKGKSLCIARQIAKDGVAVIGIDLNENPNIENTGFIQGNSKEIAKVFNRKIDILFIDGDHSYQGCKDDIESWYPHMKENGVMLFHDHDESSPGVLQAVSEFVNSHKIKEYKMFKRTDKNTSMALIRL